MYKHPSQVQRASEAISKGIGRRMCITTRRRKMENRGEEHVLLKGLRSSTMEASAEGDARSITKKAKASASMQKMKRVAFNIKQSVNPEL